MKRTSTLAALIAATLMTGLGCGDPAIGKLQTINLSTSGTAVKGEGGTLQLSALANYSSPKAVDVSNKVTYTATPTGTDVNGAALAAPPQTITISATGLVTAVAPFVCTFTNVGTAMTPSYALTGSYQITAAYQGVTSQPVFIGVESATGNGPSAACGP
jgi:hypothetical protein